MPASKPPAVAREQVLAFRLAGHHLGERLPKEDLLAAARGGLHDPTPGTAAIALAARVEGLSPGDVARALGRDKTLLRLWGLRGAPYVIPTADLDVFSRATAPAAAGDSYLFMDMAAKEVMRVGLRADDLVGRVADAAEDVLDGRALAKQQLCAEVAARVGEDLTPEQRAQWEADTAYMNEPTGRHLIAVAMRCVSLDGRYGFACDPNAPREEPPHVRLDQWLGDVLPARPRDLDPARTELVRRFLRLYGPATPAQLTTWAGVSTAQGKRMWALADVVPVTHAGKTAWIHADDQAALAAPPRPAGVRLLPAYDPYLATGDRGTLIPDPSYHREAWRPAGNPGAVLVDGEVVALWKIAKAGKKAVMKVSPIRPFADAARKAVMAEAAALAPFREVATLDVVFTDG